MSAAQATGITIDALYADRIAVRRTAARTRPARRDDPALGIRAPGDGAAAGYPQHAQRLHGAVAVFGDSGAASGLRGAGGGLGGDRVVGN